MLGMHTVMLFAVVIAFNQTTKLDINEHPISLLDDVLLFICLPAFTLETVLSLVATISIINAVKIASYVVMVSIILYLHSHVISDAKYWKLSKITMMENVNVKSLS